MPQFQDSRGVAWTSSDASSSEQLFAAIDRFMTYRADTMERLDALLNDDSECIGAWVLKGFLFLLARSQSLVPNSKEAKDRAEALARLGKTNARERMLLDVLGRWVSDDMLGVQRRLDYIVTEYPHDIIALRLQHIGAIFFGRPDVLRSTVTRALSDWDESIPGAGFVYGMACMGLEEAGDYERAETLGRRGAELEPDDLWSVHSVAHVMEAQGRLEEGVVWMQRPPSYWSDRGPMRHHLWWHEALFLFEADDFERVFEYFDETLLPRSSAGYLEMANCASLLFRMEAAGRGCGERWERLLAHTRHLAVDRALIFSDVHMAIALAMAGEVGALHRFSEAVREYAHGGNSFDRQASARLTIPLVNALCTRLSGDMGAATDILNDVRFDFQNMGGSIAQRDMLEILLIDCAIAADRPRTAKRLLSEYLDQRPHSVPMQARLKEITA
ncbi:tetratricopeptide repeat protein [Tropicimonas sp. IMCC6043]|uniref:tetratricopeptide repeat protein n=2 Tax=Tropicimonas sp. IMCC6043 TaxID=2510645 RepID=UPI00101CE5FE|nr:tetratricopeptide repeat protein [Tropicimonas sp. IMCC6043]RYH07006.1 tetratricopeptide repeat protein [Tropicimonas sp. IMCC6043]